MTQQTSAPVTAAWWEIPVSDLAQAQAFFGEVFGWTFTPFGEGYAGAGNGGALVGGLVVSPDTVRGEGIRLYLGVTDLEATLAAAEAAGGSVVTPRTEVGSDMGWWAEIAAPDGRRIGLSTMAAPA